MKIFTVSQINKIIKDLIDNEIVLEDIVVSGELSSFSVTRGIAYFTLKDNDNILNCVQFGNTEEFKIGDLVECRGNIKYYPKGGKLSFNALNIKLSGQGELYKQFLELKDKLEKEGLFDDLHKIPIPKYINSIGVVTSATGAVLQDIRNVTTRRNPNLDIYVYDAQVQGKFAVKDVIEGITYFDNYTDVDLIIVARGGGSIEDLSCFNDEELARVAYICNKPLISAVGHETDFTILDFVSDLRAPTPSAAAELVSLDCIELSRQIKDEINLIEKLTIENFEAVNNQLTIKLNEIDNSVNSVINDNILYINNIVNNLDKSVEKKIENTRYGVEMILNTLVNASPIKTMDRGYAIVTKDEYIVYNENIEINDEIKIQTKDLKLKAIVTKKEKYDRERY